MTNSENTNKKADEKKPEDDENLSYGIVFFTMGITFMIIGLQNTVFLYSGLPFLVLGIYYFFEHQKVLKGKLPLNKNNEDKTD